MVRRFLIATRLYALGHYTWRAAWVVARYR